jgi:hypothetical protein
MQAECGANSSLARQTADHHLGAETIVAARSGRKKFKGPTQWTDKDVSLSELAGDDWTLGGPVSNSDSIVDLVKQDWRELSSYL